MCDFLVRLYDTVIAVERGICLQTKPFWGAVTVEKIGHCMNYRKIMSNL